MLIDLHVHSHHTAGVSLQPREAVRRAKEAGYQIDFCLYANNYEQADEEHDLKLKEKEKQLASGHLTDISKVLYLGASTGTTISHLSDILGESGEIYAVEIAAQCMKSLIALSDRRRNIIPIHADARQPQEYAEVGEVDTIYMDVAQPDQDDILIKNAKMFLKKGGIAMIAIKSQSIDVTQRLQNMVSNNGLSVRVNNDLFGSDPSPGRTKELWVSYAYQGQRRNVRVREGDNLRIP